MAPLVNAMLVLFSDAHVYPVTPSARVWAAALSNWQLPPVPQTTSLATQLIHASVFLWKRSFSAQECSDRLSSKSTPVPCKLHLALKHPVLKRAVFVHL